LEELGVDGRIILKWIFKKLDMKTWTALIWLKIEGQVCGACECGNGPWGSTNYAEFLD
jgi:hypothetical protein